jgi:hypothetical protein
MADKCSIRMRPLNEGNLKPVVFISMYPSLKKETAPMTMVASQAV